MFLTGIFAVKTVCLTGFRPKSSPNAKTSVSNLYHQKLQVLFSSSAADKQLSPEMRVIKCKSRVRCNCDLSPSPGRHLHTEPTAAATSPARLHGLQSCKAGAIPESHHAALYTKFTFCASLFFTSHFPQLSHAMALINGNPLETVNVSRLIYLQIIFPSSTIVPQSQEEFALLVSFLSFGS